MLAEISELAKAIERAGCRTVGEYLARLDAHFDHTCSTDNQRVRHRHTRRDMYEAEFEAIWEAQRRHHPDLLTKELKYGAKGRQTYPKHPEAAGRDTNLVSQYGIYGLIFFQRTMYWPKSVVGRCELEPKCKRCRRADRAAQRFRMLQEVNNLRLLDSATGVERGLTQDERSTLIDYLSAAEKRSFDQIRKTLGFREHVRFNYERAERSKLKGHETDAALGAGRALGKRWKGLPDKAKDAIVEVLIYEEREDEALRRLTDDCGLRRDEGERALGVNLTDGYMSFSREAIEKLLPHLERGLHLMADDESNSALHAAGYLRPDQRTIRQRDFLPPSPDLPNPIVRQALVEVRKVVNAVIREYGKPTRIHVELAREAKKSLQQRDEIRFENAKRRKRREAAAEEIEELGHKATPPAIRRYLLWQEQDGFCAYSARKISPLKLFGGEVDVDHILPRWRSLDDSMANKVVCFHDENDRKGDQTPREWLEGKDPEKYERVLRLAEKLPYNKRRKFLLKDIELDDFVNRQLTDTAYISRCVTQYLRCLGTEIVTPRGQMTADLRYFWGLNSILDPQGRGKKNRADHRHHAIDAIVIALTDRKRLHALANDRGKDVSPPWEAFWKDAKRAVAKINVSHRVQRRLHGALHDEFFYGATQKRTDQTQAPAGEQRPWANAWVEQTNAYVRRKPVTEIRNRKHLDKVRDPTIRGILKAHLRERGLDPDQSGAYPPAAFKGENTPRMPTSGVPIKKVRMLDESETIRSASERRSYQYVKPDNNHHIVYRAVGEGQNERWTAEVCSTLGQCLGRANQCLRPAQTGHRDQKPQAPGQSARSHNPRDSQGASTRAGAGPRPVGRLPARRIQGRKHAAHANKWCPHQESPHARRKRDDPVRQRAPFIPVREA